MGSSDFVEIQLTAKDAGMVQAWLEAKKGPEEYEAAMDKMGRKGKESSDTLSGAMDDMLKKWTGIQAVIGLAQKALDFFMESNKRAIQEGKQATLTIDESMRKLMVQADLRSAGISEQQLKQLVGKSATDAAVSIPFATQAATQAISSGFKAEDILKEGGLDSILQFANATNSTDGDPAQMVKSLGLFLGATGQDLTSANLRRTMVGTQRLFKGTNMQASALPFLAREGSQITDFGGLSGDDTLAIGSVLLNTLGEEKSATAFRGSVTDLAMLGKDKTKVQGLASMGLKPEDVDMVGESFQQVLERLNEATSQMDPAKRNLAMGQVFKTESLPGIMALMSDAGRAQYATNRALMGDEEGFIADAGIATSGSAARIRRAETREQLADDASGRGEIAIQIDEARAASKERGEAPTVTFAKEAVAQQLSAVGASGEKTTAVSSAAVDLGIGTAGGLGGLLGKLALEFTFRDEDNRAMPVEHRARGIEGQGE